MLRCKIEIETIMTRKKKGLKFKKRQKKQREMYVKYEGGDECEHFDFGQCHVGHYCVPFQDFYQSRK